MPSHPGQHICPHCTSKQIIRSCRRESERIVPFLRPYRCNKCHSRFYDLRWFSLPTPVV
jgi:hypothetical protein